MDDNEIYSRLRSNIWLNPLNQDLIRFLIGRGELHIVITDANSEVSNFILHNLDLAMESRMVDLPENRVLMYTGPKYYFIRIVNDNQIFVNLPGLEEVKLTIKEN